MKLGLPKAHDGNNADCAFLLQLDLRDPSGQSQLGMK